MGKWPGSRPGGWRPRRRWRPSIEIPDVLDTLDDVGVLEDDDDGPDDAGLDDDNDEGPDDDDDDAPV
jgi:hypothetical protein